jgi:hypothetical protein
MTNPKREEVSMDERMPAEVELRGIGLSFTLGAGKNLSRTWQRELRTESESRFRSAVTRDALEISFSPPILIDALWPAMNMQLGGIKREFSSGETKVFLASIRGVAEGLVDFSEDAKKEIASLVNSAVSGTAMERRGYNPMQDPQIVSTLENLADHFRQQPSQGVSNIEYRDFGSPKIDIQLCLETDFRHIEKNAGLSVRQGTTIDVLISGHGNLATMMASRTTAEKAAATNIDSVTISSDGLLVVVNDKPIAYLDRLRMDRGGVVTLEKMRLEGVAGQAEGMESVVRMVASAMNWVSGGAPIDGAMKMGANSRDVLATFVPDAVRVEIEKTLTQGVKEILLANRNAVPELDLVEIMGT